ncbi:hypothetical protein EAO73_30460 [Streptomyces sp. col6]|nr:hypothetical protein EAO73_30460 [Streptomyces sp. col6]
MDRAVAALSAERDEAVARVARLTELAEELAAVSRADEVVGVAEAAAGEVLEAARTEAAAVREEAEAARAATRERTASVLAHQEQEHAERWKAAEGEIAGAEAARAAEHAALLERAEADLAAARKDRAEAEEAARHGQEDAQARAAELVARARVREERVVRETGRILREHEEGREEVQAHMAHVRSSLAALTGRVSPSRD